MVPYSTSLDILGPMMAMWNERLMKLSCAHPFSQLGSLCTGTALFIYRAPSWVVWLYTWPNDPTLFPRLPSIWLTLWSTSTLSVVPPSMPFLICLRKLSVQSSRDTSSTNSHRTQSLSCCSVWWGLPVFQWMTALHEMICTNLWMNEWVRAADGDTS